MDGTDQESKMGRGKPCTPARPIASPPSTFVEVRISMGTACDCIGPVQWELATDCPGWTVRGQLAHLIGIGRMLLGEAPPPPRAILPDHARNGYAELNEPWVEARRRIPGNEPPAEFIFVTGRRIHELRTLASEAFDVRSGSPVGELPYPDFLATRVFDCWAHAPDMRRVLGRPGGHNGEGEQTVLDRCERTMPEVVGKRVAPPDGTTVRFVVTGVLGRQVKAVVADGRAEAVPADASGATTTLIVAQEPFWRLGFDRVIPLRAVAAGQAKVIGDFALGHRVPGSMAFMN